MSQISSHREGQQDQHGKHRATAPVDSGVPRDGRHREDADASPAEGEAKRRWFSRR